MAETKKSNAEQKLEVQLSGIKLSSPFIVASGPLTARIEQLEKIKEAGAGAVDDAFGKRVIAFDHEQRAAENGAIHGDQRQVDAQRLIQRGQVPLEGHLQNLDHGGDHADKTDQREKAQVHPA